MQFLWKRRDEDKYKRFIRTKIKEAREERGMTQADLAKRIYKTQKNVSDLERGETDIDVTDLMGIAYVLEKPIRYFFPVYVPTEGDLSVKEWELIHFFRRIQNEAMENLAVKQVRELAEASIEADNQMAKRRHELIAEEYEKVKGTGIAAADEAGRRGEERFEEEQARKKKR